MPVRSLIQPVVAGLGDVEPLVFSQGEELALDEASHRLVENAYTRVDLVMDRGKVHHFAGKTVLDAPASFACIHEFPLLPRMTCVVPQTDRSAVLRVEVLYFQHLSIGGLDEVKFIF